METRRFEITEIFGSNVFNYKTMKERLPKDTFRSLMDTLERGAPLSPAVADVVANAMKDWAIEKGATHYTHWLQPLTGKTAEKHDSFISPTRDGGVIMEFSGKQLVRGEPDASSFPSGGLRATFEARGYTAWDITSPAFLKEDSAGNVTLCIPTTFCSFNGEALDTKTPLLRSMQAVETQGLRVLKALRNGKTQIDDERSRIRVFSEVGVEQEYFLVDKDYFSKRLDLLLSGRTLFGTLGPKGQELSDQYWGAIKDRVSAFMSDLDMELWKMGIASKTKHNEVAPGQYELAPVYSSINIAADQNQLIMETMQKVALRHGLVCLLHEKPYKGVNGSGKHNNWSLSTSEGINLLDPGNTPHENEQFLLFLCALVRAVDVHADLLRASTANAGNEHRLGAHEAPPAIISIFLGSELTGILNNIGRGEKVQSREKGFIDIGVDTLPHLPKDNTDRNRTSPFAFTGNKFEFRMVGSSASVSEPMMVLNTIVAQSLDEIATRLEKAQDINQEASAIIREIINQHGRIIFDGNNYSDEWLREAEKRGLKNTASAITALEAYVSGKALDLFRKYKVLSNEELRSRYEVYLDQYAKQINIEAKTCVAMARKEYIPCVIRYVSELTQSINHMNIAFTPGPGGKSSAIETICKSVSELLDTVYAECEKLEAARQMAESIDDFVQKARAYSDDIRPIMKQVRNYIDKLEEIMPADIWPVPSYTDMLFRI